MPTGSRRWVTADIDESAATALAGRLGIRLAVARVLVARQLGDPDEVERFLDPRLATLRDPFELPDMEAAVERIRRAIENAEPITVFGDYDVDGVTSAALLCSVLNRLGAQVSPFLPHREIHGYGLTRKAVEECFLETRPKLVVTVDCGTCAAESVVFAREQGVEVVITDHHELSGELSPAVAVVNPQRSPCASETRLAGVGVAFKLCHALVKRAIDKQELAPADLDLRGYLDLVAVGTVADIVPLTDENRTLVRYGLRRLLHTESMGLRALMDVARMGDVCHTYHVAFLLAPRLNAAGRLGSAHRALELLLSEDPAAARRLASELDNANSRRKTVEGRIRDEAEAEINGYFDASRHFGIVTGREGWHVGTVGIVASRLCATYARPVVVLGFDEAGLGRGSCRGVEPMDLVKALQKCDDLLESYGGHQMAAGLTIRRENFEEFRARFNAACAELLDGEDLRPVTPVDAWLGDLSEADRDLYQAVEDLRPFGEGNPEPVWGVKKVCADSPRIVGGQHLKLAFEDAAGRLEAIAFNMADRESECQGELDVLFRLQLNRYRGEETLQAVVSDWRPHGTE